MTSGLWREVVALHRHEYPLFSKYPHIAFLLVTITYSSVYTNNRTVRTMGPALETFARTSPIDLYRFYSGSAFLFWLP
jgi:hypothetical protein